MRSSPGDSSYSVHRGMRSGQRKGFIGAVILLRAKHLDETNEWIWPNEMWNEMKTQNPIEQTTVLRSGFRVACLHPSRINVVRWIHLDASSPNLFHDLYNWEN